MNENLYLRDPLSSDLGRRFLNSGAEMMVRLGFEEFTFKKLAVELNTNESSIYRYFENKHRLLSYLVAWYWRWIEYMVVFHTNNMTDAREKIDRVLKILMLRMETPDIDGHEMNKSILHQLVIQEGSKVYLTTHVGEDNKQQFFRPYKDLCARIAAILLEYKPDYPYARSLTSTLIEMAHYQHFFMKNLPSLTDFGQEKDDNKIIGFLKTIVLGGMDFRENNS